MFTGIVSELGEIAEVDITASGKRFVIGCHSTLDGLSVGDSVAVNGVCLTVIRIGDAAFSVEAVQETLDRSNLSGVERGSGVDLERPVPADGRFDGHVVQGHVDGVGTVTSVSNEGAARRLRVAAPSRLSPYLVEKGSITVDGVSLTVTAVAEVHADPSWFEVVLIPHTLDETVLGGRGEGAEVNLEVDVLAKYVERSLEAYR